MPEPGREGRESPRVRTSNSLNSTRAGAGEATLVGSKRRYKTDVDCDRPFGSRLLALHPGPQGPHGDHRSPAAQSAEARRGGDVRRDRVGPARGDVVSEVRTVLLLHDLDLARAEFQEPRSAARWKKLGFDVQESHPLDRARA